MKLSKTTEETAMTKNSADEFSREPCATQLMETGVFDRAAFKMAYGKGASSDQKELGYRFAFSLATQAASMLGKSPSHSLNPKDNPALSSTLDRFVEGSALLKSDIYSFAMVLFISELAKAVPDWAMPSSPSRLHSEAKKSIARSFSSSPNLNSDQRGILIESLSECAAHSTKQKNSLDRSKILFVKSQIDDASNPGSSKSAVPRI